MAAPTGTLAARLYTSATPLSDVAGSADAIGDFQGLTIATEIALITNFGDFGRVFQPVSFQSVADGRTYKMKGGYDDGEIALMLGQDLSDAGQALLKSYAEASNQNTYPFKITLTGANASYDTIYFGALVASFKTQMGGVNDVIRAAVSLNINTTIFTGAS
jgi:hypothetical protein